MNLRWEDSWHREGPAGQKCPRNKCEKVREYKAMHEEMFLSSWLREDVEGTEERWRSTQRPKEEVNSVSTEAFDTCSQGESWKVVVILK